MGVPVGTRTCCGNRERHFAGLLDVPISTCAASHGVAGTHRWPLAYPFLRPDPVRCLQERFGTFWPAVTAGDRLGAVARHLLCVEGVQDGKPDRQTRLANGWA